MGGCAAKLRKTFEPQDKVEKPELTAEAEEDKKAAAAAVTEEQFKERVKEIVGDYENEITVVDEIQGCKQRPSLSLLFKQEEVKDWAESENLNNGKQEPILEDQENDPTRPKEEDEQRQPEPGKISAEQQQETAETPTMSEQAKPEGVGVAVAVAISFAS
ncbi:hypothetical protein MLD38_021484 [Melastoma candidum]|uniref:Uncharacterized protein n=1 Tax=Melastoma candidum TaxID=119954 RepID=A0ACB9QG33_9MYRT|nr:hypothetical protein MLD38_021484 [Melastoma candidum]